MNETALPLFKKMMEQSTEFRVKVEERDSGATVIDAGIAALGGYAAGRMVTETCLGGLGKASFTSMRYGDIILPTIHVETDFPAIATLGAQFAGWRIKVGDYFGMGSGPARALALKPKELYQKIEYKDDAKCAVIILESDHAPSEEAIAYIADKCKVKPKDIYVVTASTSSLVGSIQISGRIVETGIHKLTELGFDPQRIVSGCGYAPIAPIHPKSAKAMGRTNDALYYGGITYYTVDYEDDEKLAEFVQKSPSSTAKEYGRPFYEIFKSVNFDFYQIDPNLFAPAVVIVNNTRTGTTHRAGNTNVEVLKETMGLR